MKFINLVLVTFLCLFVAQANAQFSSLELYGGVGVFSSQGESFSTPTTGPSFIGSGEGFVLFQEGTRTIFTNTEYETGQNLQFGLEGHYAVGTHGSVYAGLRLNASLLRYREGTTTSELVTSGPVDTVLVEPGNGGGGNPIDFCPGRSFGFGTDEPDRAFALDIGIPIGYRHRFFNDRMGLRVQGSVNVPVFSRHTTDDLSLRQDASLNCVRFEQVEANASSAYGLNAFVFRVGGGVDFSIGHSFSLGVMVEQQLNSTIKTNADFVVNEGNFIGVPEISSFKPLNISLVGRYVIR